MPFHKGDTPWNKDMAFPYIPRGPRKLEVERFWEKVNKAGPVPAHVRHLGHCWEWVGAPFKRYGKATNLQPYGFFRLNAPSRKQELAHRYSWTLGHGPIPNGMQVLHQCDNPRCVRPSHLWLGTHAENHTDCTVKGRRRPSLGESNGMAKLTEKQVTHIRKLAETMPITDVAKRMGLPYMRVYKAATRRRWAHLS